VDDVAGAIDVVAMLGELTLIWLLRGCALSKGARAQRKGKRKNNRAKHFVSPLECLIANKRH
jgi:hypothetical protein